MTRDSILWYLVIVGAVLTYLGSMPAPTSWTWAQWMQTISAVVGIVAGYLRASPLDRYRDPNDKGTVDTTKIVPMIGLLLALLVVTACGPKTIKTAATISDQFAQSLVTAQVCVTDLHAIGKISDTRYREIQRTFEQVAKTGLSVNAALRASDNKTAMVQVAACLKLVTDLLNADWATIAPAEKALLSTSLNGIRAVLLAYSAALGVVR